MREIWINRSLLIIFKLMIVECIFRKKNLPDEIPINIREYKLLF